MGVIKVELFTTDQTTDGATYTLKNNVGSLNSAFVRRTTSIDKQSGSTNTTSNITPTDACSAVYLSSTTQLTYKSTSANAKRMVGEVWRYTGAASGPDEFIVRGRYAITLTTATASQAVTGIVNTDKCIPFITGTTSTATSTSDYDSSTVSCYIDASDNIQLQRGATTGTLVVYVTVVEFTGSNWSVGHGVSNSHDTTDPTIVLNTSSTGTGGSTFDISSWDTAMIIEGSLESDTSETGLSDNLGCWVPGVGTTQAQFLLHQDSNARNDGSSYCHVLCHPSMVTSRFQDANFPETNGTNGTYATGATAPSALDEAGLEWFADTSGVGTAHARGRVSGWLSAASATVNHYVHRSGNNVRVTGGLVNLSGITGTISIIIDNVDLDNQITNAQQNVVIAASAGGFGATQGTGSVKLTQNIDGSGTSVTQTIDSWSDTSIQFDTSAGALANTNCYVFVTTDTGATAAKPVTVGLPPETYQEAINAIVPAPDHYWTFQNVYNDEIGTAIANGIAAVGTTFPATPIVKGDTHSLLLDSTTDYCSPSDQSDMNKASNATNRYMGGWIQLDRIIQALSVIWEEGAQVNNYALLVGFGNFAMWQFADDGGDYVQAYHDIKLTPNRPYHVMMEFKSSTYDDSICACYLDGVKQSLTNGNPWEVSAFPSHSGNISWGHEGTENLQTGDSRGVDNVDIAFASPVNCNYAHWYSWHNKNPIADVRTEMFAKGALADTTITGGTEAAMQLLVDAKASTVIPDWPCGIEIGVCSTGNFTLTFDNITFDSRCSMPIRYVGVDTLTIILTNGSDLDESKCEAPYGGTILFQRPATFTIDGLINGCEVRIYDDNGTGGSHGIELTGIETLSGTSYQYSHDGTTNDIVIQMIADGYEEVLVPHQLNSTDQTVTIVPTVELNL